MFFLQAPPQQPEPEVYEVYKVDAQLREWLASVNELVYRLADAVAHRVKPEEYSEDILEHWRGLRSRLLDLETDLLKLTRRAAKEAVAYKPWQSPAQYNEDVWWLKSTAQLFGDKVEALAKDVNEALTLSPTRAMNAFWLRNAMRNLSD